MLPRSRPGARRRLSDVCIPNHPWRRRPRISKIKPMRPQAEPTLPDTTGFYRQLAPCRSFDTVGDANAFTPLPADWAVVIGDIRDSTPAIAAGRYKDVNMVGAACIVAALNAVPDLDVPFVFRGDGATLAVPSGAVPAVREALLKTRALAADAYAMDLRVGVVPLTVLRASGADVTVARLEISPGNHLALFAGTGIELADRLIKSDAGGAAGYSIVAAATPEPDLSGLSCRWEPLRATRGRMVSLLVRAREPDAAAAAALYGMLVDDIDMILGADPFAGRPVRADNLRFRWPPRGLAIEAKLTKGAQSLWRRRLAIACECLVQWCLERFDLSAGSYDAPTYREEMQANTDARRFDGMLRMVVDCTGDELGRLRAMLDDRHARGEIDYGMHVADAALMTCLVFDLAESRHLHFIDGGDGGFAMAARELKRQLANRVDVDTSNGSISDE